jgi:hypothetical protein
MASADAAARVRFIDLLPAAADPAAELRAGLAAPAPWIAPKFFYDALGARLFEAICELPEYTLPRDEQAIFDRYTNEIAALIGPDSTLIDLGAGNCAKAERLFTVLRPAQYVAVDIAGPFLLTQLELLARRHRTIDVIGIVADFSAGLVLPPMVRGERQVIFILDPRSATSPKEAWRFYRASATVRRRAPSGRCRPRQDPPAGRRLRRCARRGGVINLNAERRQPWAGTDFTWATGAMWRSSTPPRAASRCTWRHAARCGCAGQAANDVSPRALGFIPKTRTRRRLLRCRLCCARPALTMCGSTQTPPTALRSH